MKILVTGGAGFIGSHLADRLKAEGHQVRGIDNFLTGHNQWDGLERGDVARQFAFERFGKQDVIVHCAASYDDRLKWHRDTDVNVNGAINVAVAAREWESRVVYFQTALIYGQNPYGSCDPTDPDDPSNGWVETDVLGHPIERSTSDGYPLSTSQDINPESSYAISKYAAEQYLRLADIPLTVFRLANIYGPRNLSGPIPTFFKRLTAGERCTIVDSRRDFVYIDDLVRLATQAITNGVTGTYHASTGSDYPVGQLYEAVVDALDAHGASDPVFQERGPDDAPTILLDPTETTAAFGWQATTDIDEGVQAAVDWYRANPPEHTYTHLAMKG